MLIASGWSAAFGGSAWTTWFLWTSGIWSASFVSSWPTTIAAGHTRRWGLVFQNQFRRLFQPVVINIDCPRAVALQRPQCSAAYITNIAWRRRLRSTPEYFRTTAQPKRIRRQFPTAASKTRRAKGHYRDGPQARPTVYRMLKFGKDYVDRGTEYYETKYRSTPDQMAHQTSCGVRSPAHSFTEGYRLGFWRPLASFSESPVGSQFCPGSIRPVKSWNRFTVFVNASFNPLAPPLNQHY